jgi:hypothetical protein
VTAADAVAPEADAVRFAQLWQSRV